MQKTILALTLLLLLLVLTSAVIAPAETDVPESARKTIQDDYLEWITPRGVPGRHPVVWLTEVTLVKAGRKFVAILGLSAAQADSISGSVSAQILIVLQDVSIYRLCRVFGVPPW